MRRSNPINRQRFLQGSAALVGSRLTIRPELETAVSGRPALPQAVAQSFQKNGSDLRLEAVFDRQLMCGSFASPR